MNTSVWRLWINSERGRANSAWYRAGKRGEGRLVVEDRNLCGAEGKVALFGARFVRCNLSGAKFPYGLCDEIELVDCCMDDSGLTMGSMKRSHLERSTFRNTSFLLTDFDGSVIEGGSFERANLDGTRWWSVQARGVDFRGARFPKSDFNNAVFENCDFRDAQLVRGDPTFDGGTAWSTRFINCDFTGADLTGLKLRVNRFERCKLAGSRGKPVLDEPATFVDNDLSEAKILAKWR